MRPITVCALMLMLGGCATTDPKLAKAYIDANLPPNYRALIVEEAKREFFDPYSIRSAGIAEPRSWRNLILVCVEANAKNRMGGYSGVQSTAYQFLHSAYWKSEVNNPFLCPSDIAYKPFPELEAIK